jgi:hypothetical protein
MDYRNKDTENVVVFINETQYTAGEVACRELRMHILRLIAPACVGLDHFGYPPLAITLFLPCMQPPIASKGVASDLVPLILVRMSDAVGSMVVHNIVMKE